MTKKQEQVAEYLKKIGSQEQGDEDTDKQMEALSEGRDILALWDEGATLYDELVNKIDGFRNFYLGDSTEQGVADLEGEVTVIANLGATLIDLYVYMLSNNPPSIQFLAESSEPLAVTEANFKEDLVEKLFADAYFHKRFQEGVKNQVSFGWCLLYPFWNKNKKDGGKKGTFDLASLNLFTTRVQYKASDSEEIESFITTSRYSQKKILDEYNFEAFPDSEDPVISKTIESDDDDKTTVFRFYGENSIKIVVNGQVVKTINHNLGFVPLVQIDNIKVTNDLHGHSEIERWQELAKEINALLSAASELSRDLAYPPLLEYNNALGNRKIPKWRGQKIPVKRSQRGEALEFLVNPAQIQPLIVQAEKLIKLFHFIALMPEAAGGIFPANVTSGFQAKLAMQPATLTTDSRKIDWDWAIKKLVKMAFKMLDKYNPEALSISENSKVSGEISSHEMKIIWPENLPIDIAREVQNLVLGIQHNLTSVTQSIDRYNALLGLGSPTDTKDYLRQEADDVKLNPDRALKVAKVKETIDAMKAKMSEAQSKLKEMRGQMGEQMAESARQSNPTNLQRSASSPMPEDRRVVPPTAREAVTPESTGGVTITPDERI